MYLKNVKILLREENREQIIKDFRPIVLGAGLCSGSYLIWDPTCQSFVLTPYDPVRVSVTKDDFNSILVEVEYLKSLREDLPYDDCKADKMEAILKELEKHGVK